MSSFSIFGDYPLIISPNIGKPVFICLSKYTLKLKNTFSFEFWIGASKQETLENLQQYLENSIYLTPLLGLNNQTRRANRGENIKIEIENLIPTEYSAIEDEQSIIKFTELESEEQLKGFGGESPRETLNHRNIFLNKPQCVKCIGFCKLSKEIKAYLGNSPFLLFDVIQNFPEESIPNRILYHSICIFKRRNWKDLDFAHITDLHISKRNDDMLGVIKKNSESILAKSTRITLDTVIKNPYHQIKKGFQSKILKKEIFESNEKEKAIEKRFLNPNNMLRDFISNANSLALKGKLDFVALTGDIIDFVIKSDSITSVLDTSYEYTNWERFLDIILNRELQPRNGYQLEHINLQEELLVPIFTILGNHDYRIGHYSIQSLNIYKAIGLKANEAAFYADKSAPIASLVVSKKGLEAYFQFINPFQDFFLKLGEHTFIFLDSGPDSFLEIKHLLMASPALAGLNDNQLTYLKMLDDHIIAKNQEGLTFVFTHAPFLNPILKKSVRSKVKQIFQLKTLHDLDAFKESNLMNAGLADTRSDYELEYRAGTISNNWIESIGLIQRMKAITLNGHTHLWREFRTERSDPSISHTGYGKRVLNPFAIYWDDYTQQHGISDLNFFERNIPFHFQTPALGLANELHGLKAGAYRYIQIQKNKLSKISMHFLQS